MAVKVGNSYVSEAAYSYAASQAREKTGVMKDLAEKFPHLKFNVDTSPFSGTGMNHVSISPKILKEMEKDPEKRVEYEALIYDIAHTDVQSIQPGRSLRSHGFIIGDDGGLRGWGVSTGEDGTRRSQSSTRRSKEKNWWRKMLDPHKRKAVSSEKLQKNVLEKNKEKAEKKLCVQESSKEKLSNVSQREQDDAERIWNGSRSLRFYGTEDFSKYLRENFSVVREGVASISGKYLRECVTDEDKRSKLLENLRTADGMLAAKKEQVGFQGMKVKIDEDGNMSTESSSGTVTINEDKSRRQIAAAATKADMQIVLARLQQDLEAVEDGLKRNMCDDVEVEKAKKLIEQAKQRMAKLPDRAPTPEEQSRMAVNMLI